MQIVRRQVDAMPQIELKTRGMICEGGRSLKERSGVSRTAPCSRAQCFSTVSVGEEEQFGNPRAMRRLPTQAMGSLRPCC